MQTQQHTLLSNRETSNETNVFSTCSWKITKRLSYHLGDSRSLGRKFYAVETIAIFLFLVSINIILENIERLIIVHCDICYASLVSTFGGYQITSDGGMQPTSEPFYWTQMFLDNLQWIGSYVYGTEQKSFTLNIQAGNPKHTSILSAFLNDESALLLLEG